MSTETSRKTKPWLRVVLGLSLALNLVVVGIAVGATYRMSGKHRGWDRPPASFGVMLFRDLDRQTRRDLRRSAEGDHRDFHARRKAEAEALAAALRATPFDPTVVADLLNAQVMTRQAFQERVQTAWLEKITEMSDAERAEIATRMVKGGAWRKPPKP